MKKSILFGALAIFAISALGIQNVNAQNVDVKAKKSGTTAVVEKKDKPAATTVEQTPVKEKKSECCDKKQEVKKDGCCDKKNCESKKATPEAKMEKKDAQQPSADKNVTKPVTKKEVKNAKFKAKTFYEKQ